MANYNLNQAIGLYNQDQVRTQTMYEIEFNTGFTNIDNTLKRMQVYGQNFTLPDRTINYEDLQYRAYKIPVPTTIDMMQDHSVTVYADVRGDLRRAMLDWQAAIINPDITGGSFFESNRRPTRVGGSSQGGGSASNGAEPSIVISLLAPDYQTALEQTKIYGTRVMKVGGLELSNISGSISTFQVDFKSVYWEQKSFMDSSKAGTYNQDGYRYTNLGGAGEAGNSTTATIDTVNSTTMLGTTTNNTDTGTIGQYTNPSSLRAGSGGTWQRFTINQ